MMNYVFVILIILGLVVGVYIGTKDAMQADSFPARISALKAKGQNITEKLVETVKVAVDLCFGYIGIMTLWLGIMRVAEKAGIISSLAKLLKPVMIKLFPQVPPDHPAMGAMIMNIAANMLGLDNAATPLGLKAMKELQSLNKEKDSATDSMIMFMAINTSSITLIPFSVMAWRASMGSSNAQIILGPATLATICSTAAAITITYIFIKLSTPTANFNKEYAEGKFDVIEKAQEEYDRSLNK